jgi:hypothetical protein
MSSAFHNWASSRIERRAYASRVMGGSLLVFASKALSVALMCTVYAKGLKEEEEEEDGRRLLGTATRPPPPPPPPAPTTPPSPHRPKISGKPVQCIENPLEDADLPSGIAYTLAVTALVLAVMWLARPAASGRDNDDSACCSGLRTALTPAVPLLVLAELLAWTWQAEVLALREHLFGAGLVACAGVGVVCLVLGAFLLNALFADPSPGAGGGGSSGSGGSGDSGGLAVALLSEQAHQSEEECEEEEQEPTWRGLLLDAVVLCAAFQLAPPTDTGLSWVVVLLFLLAVGRATVAFRLFSAAHPQRGVLGAAVEIVDGVLAVVCAFTTSALVHAVASALPHAAADESFTHEDSLHELRKALASFGTTCAISGLLARQAINSWLKAEQAGRGPRGKEGGGSQGKAARRLVQRRQIMDLVFAMTRIGIGWALENVTGAFACWITVGELDHQPDLALLITWGIALAACAAAAVGVPRAHRRELVLHRALAEKLESELPQNEGRNCSERAREQFA